MTPLAERAWQYPMSKPDRIMLGNMLAGAQFFDCTALAPVIEARGLCDPEEYLGEMFEAQMPANRTWIQTDQSFAALIADRRAEGFLQCLAVIERGDDMALLEFSIFRDGQIECPELSGHALTQSQHKEAQDDFGDIMRSVWFSIEAMQTPGGLCHNIVHSPTRQHRRNASRAGTPIHKWVEIRLGRERKINGRTAGTETERTLAWHYRRGHRINHPNPNYPKWRKGGWCGDPAAGIRSHTYVVEVPDP